MIEFRLRPTLSDRELNLLNSRSWPEHTDRTYDRMFARSLGHVGAFEDDRLIGFVNVATDGDRHAFLLDVAVDRDYRRRGVGRELVRISTELATEAGCVWLHVDYEPHLDAFYRGAGFRPTSAGLIRLGRRTLSIQSVSHPILVRGELEK